MRKIPIPMLALVATAVCLDLTSIWYIQDKQLGSLMPLFVHCAMALADSPTNEVTKRPRRDHVPG